MWLAICGITNTGLQNLNLDILRGGVGCRIDGHGGDGIKGCKGLIRQSVHNHRFANARTRDRHARHANTDWSRFITRLGYCSLVSLRTPDV